MRRRWIVWAVPVVAVAAIVTGEATAAPRSSHAALPKLVIPRNYKGIKPKTIGFSGDGGNIVTNLKWSTWNDRKAVGHGTSDVLTCNPNCATGGGTRERTTVTFSRPRHGHWTRYVELRHTQPRIVGHYGKYTWPEDAS